MLTTHPSPPHPQNTTSLTEGTESVIADEGMVTDDSIVGTFSELLPHIDIGTTVTVSIIYTGTVCMLPPANDSVKENRVSYRGGKGGISPPYLQFPPPFLRP